MTFTVALLILALGILIGYWLPGPVAALKAYYHRRRYQPEVLQPWTPSAPPQATKHE